jgi:creatinine amidohydrolase
VPGPVASHDLYHPVEMIHRFDGSVIETSLMLEFRRDLVHMSKAKNVISSAMAIAKEFTHLSTDGPHGDGPIAQHLDAAGASGDAAKSTAANARKPPMTGRRLHRLLPDMAGFFLRRLYADADHIR